jgi:prefoldin subunit 5
VNQREIEQLETDIRQLEEQTQALAVSVAAVQALIRSIDIRVTALEQPLT